MVEEYLHKLWIIISVQLLRSGNVALYDLLTVHYQQRHGNCHYFAHMLHAEHIFHFVRILSICCVMIMMWRPQRTNQPMVVIV